MMRKILYSIAVFALIIFGSQNDMIGAGAVLLMYVLAVVEIAKGECALSKPSICILGIVIFTVIAGVVNQSFSYDTCITSVKLSVLGIPFLLKKDFCKEWVLPNVYIAISATALISIVLYITRFIAYNGYGDIRMQSIIGYANSSCVVFLVGVFLSVYYMRCGYIKRCILLLIICAAAAILTFSRLGFVCFAFSLVMYVFFSYPKSRCYILTVLVSAAVVGIALVLSGYYKVCLGSTMVSRIECWIDALAVILRKPWGIGAGVWKELQYSVQSADYSIFQIHNSFLQIMLDGGVIAFAFFALFIVYVFRCSKSNALILSATIMMLSHAFVDMDFYYICLPFTLGVVMRLNYNENVYIGKYVAVIYVIIGTILCLGVYLLDSTDNNYIKKLSEDYETAYFSSNVDDMYRISSELVNIAPKQKRMYDMYRKTYMTDIRQNNKISDMAWKVYVEGKNIALEGPPVEIDNKIMIPIRTVAEVYGYKVKWDNVTQEMSIFKDDELFSSAKVKNKIRYNEQGTLMHDVGEIFVVGNRLMIQAEEIGKYLPISVQIDDNKTIYFKKLTELR